MLASLAQPCPCPCLYRITPCVSTDGPEWLECHSLSRQLEQCTTLAIAESGEQFADSRTLPLLSRVGRGTGRLPLAQQVENPACNGIQSLAHVDLLPKPISDMRLVTYRHMNFLGSSRRSKSESVCLLDCPFKPKHNQCLSIHFLQIVLYPNSI